MIFCTAMYGRCFLIQNSCIRIEHGPNVRCYKMFSVGYVTELYVCVFVILTLYQTG